MCKAKRILASHFNLIMSDMEITPTITFGQVFKSFRGHIFEIQSLMIFSIIIQLVITLSEIEWLVPYVLNYFFELYIRA